MATETAAATGTASLEGASLLDEILSEAKVAPESEGYEVTKRGVQAFIAELVAPLDQPAEFRGDDIALAGVQLLRELRAWNLARPEHERVRFLGVASEKPSAVFPELEPVGRALPGFEASAWFGLMAPAGTPVAAVERLNAEVNRALADPEVSKLLLSRGFEPQTLSPAAWGAFIASETTRWGDLIKRANLKAE